MDIDNLTKMANNIGTFFESEPDHEAAVTGIVQHITRFWEPRMRKQIITYVEQDGANLLALVKEAVQRLPKPD
ncbi:MAG: formate dehydrogenase subunit delta [Methylococcales bacterium]|nr:formate dehydrogenase subunit delta [Methylococcales bacterium]